MWGYTKHTIHMHAATIFTRSFVADMGIYSVQCLTRSKSIRFLLPKLQSNVINWHLLNYFLECLALHLFAFDYYYLSDWRKGFFLRHTVKNDNFKEVQDFSIPYRSDFFRTMTWELHFIMELHISTQKHKH